MSRECFRVNLHSVVAWMSRNSLLETDAIPDVYATAMGIKPTTSYLVKEHWTINPKWQNQKIELWALSTYLYGTFGCVFLSCHIRVLEWIYRLWLLKCQRTFCSKQTGHLKFKWLWLDSNPQAFSSKTNTVQSFGQNVEYIFLAHKIAESFGQLK